MLKKEKKERKERKRKERKKKKKRRTHGHGQQGGDCWVEGV